MMRARGLWLVAALCLAACGEDAAMRDAGASGDGGHAPDGGSRVDAGPAPDGGSSADAGSHDAASDDAGPSDAGAGDAGATDAGATDAGASDAGPPDAGARDAGPPDAGGEPVFDVRVRADAACADLFFEPVSIAVPAGTSFTIRWTNATGCTEIDIDMGGTVPIVLGLPSGATHHDTVRSWCGSYTGTYVFRAYYAPSFPYTLDVDCSA
ncbi:MAG TPA: hypothetical protein RMH99_30195 [Sandaracinaceae bacterium LLY-WYZ-13_1]|nr:hypothetical protein [Sandaracinaceae bacterium LLY-WYZ-13_1]